jgi:hypothetical protein
MRCLFLLVLALVASWPANATTYAASGEIEALAKVNLYRAAAGVPAVTLDPVISDGAQKHVEYLARNCAAPTLDAHHEDPSLPGYTPEGAKAGMSSVIYFGLDSLEEAVDGWMSTVYHRVGIIEPSLTRVGFGFAFAPGCGVRTYGALDVVSGIGGNDTTGVVLYPGRSQPSVPVNLGSEIPNPMDEVTRGIDQYGLGYPITVLFPRDATLSFYSARLVSDSGEEMALYKLGPAPLNAGPVRCNCMLNLVPTRPLVPNTTYTVVVAGLVEYSGGPPQVFVETWTFSTAGATTPPQSESALFVESLLCNSSGTVRAAFGISPGGNERGFWLDLTLDPSFGGFMNAPVSGSSRSFVWDGLLPGMWHFARLYGYNQFGGVYSWPINFYTPNCSPAAAPAPEPATALQASTACQADRRVTASLDWAPADRASGYWLDLTEDVSFGTFAGIPTGQHAASVGDLLPGKTYFWRVWSFNDWGGNHSYGVPFETPPCW